MYDFRYVRANHSVRSAGLPTSNLWLYADAGAINYHPWANAPAPCDFPPVQCEEGFNNILVTVTPDTYAAEISWELITIPDGEVVAEGSGYSIVGAPVVEAVCLPVGSEFRVDVYDSLW